MASAVNFAKENQQRFLGELKDLLRIPSVSTAPEHKEDVRRAADFVANELRRIGLENVEVIPTGTIPWSTPIGCTPPASPRSSATPTTMCSRPSRSTNGFPALRAHRAQRQHLRPRRGGRQRPALDAGQGRRSADARHGGKLPVNVKFIIEGEEEVGGESIAAVRAQQSQN